MTIKQKAFKAAFPYTIPICTGFLFLGTSYGFLMSSKGFSFLYPMFMSALIFAGSMEFVTVNLLLASFNPIHAFLLALMVNARHLFYGISMLDKFKNVGKKKFYLIFGMCDESFSINCTTSIPDDVDKGWFMFFVTLLNYLYWVGGATLGGLLGSILHFNTKGIDFVMTALFVVIFLNQWYEAKDHLPAIVGVVSSIICLITFNSDKFIVPAMALIVICFTSMRKRLEGETKGQ
ncbi:inner membrane protein YgaZ [Clostridium oryzae]|uniref:Inner membrane protein YgaZ n=1 Tax=Clostridium oryzae TaxID=1450648 RepID=A0A1V4ICG4_9CLOT|nr:inner membrane protein YgaZ [Clostridium oryzae]